MSATTSVTDEPIQPGSIARVCRGQSGLHPCLIERVTPRGRVHVRPLDGATGEWTGEVAVPADDVWFLLTSREVRGDFGAQMGAAK